VLKKARSLGANFERSYRPLASRDDKALSSRKSSRASACANFSHGRKASGSVTGVAGDHLDSRASVVPARALKLIPRRRRTVRSRFRWRLTACRNYRWLSIRFNEPERFFKEPEIRLRFQERHARARRCNIAPLFRPASSYYRCPRASVMPVTSLSSGINYPREVFSCVLRALFSGNRTR